MKTDIITMLHTQKSSLPPGSGLVGERTMNTKMLNCKTAVVKTALLF